MEPSVDTTIRELRDAVHATSDAGLARSLRIDKSTVSSWRARGRVPKRFIDLMRDRRLPRAQTAQAPNVWSELQERALALATLRYSLMNIELLRSGDTNGATLEFRNTTRFWVVLYRAVAEIQARQSSLNVDAKTAEVLLMQEDLRDPEATAERVRTELRQDFADSPDLKTAK